MLKILGAALVLCASLGYAGGLLRQITRRRDMLRSCMELTELLSAEIRYERIPIAEALRRIRDRLEEPLGKVLCAVADSLEEGGCSSMEEIWEKTFSRAKEQLSLTDEEMSAVKDIGKNLGFLDFDAQVNHLTGCGRRLKKSMDKVQRELDEKQKLYRSLGLAAGIFAILILL